MKNKPKSTEEILTEAFLADGCRPIPVGYTPRNQKAKGRPTRVAKSGGNGKAR